MEVKDWTLQKEAKERMTVPTHPSWRKANDSHHEEVCEVNGRDVGGTPHATSVRVQKTKARQEEITQEGCSRGRTGTPVFHIAFSQTPGCLLGSTCLRPPPNRLVEARSMMTGVEYRRSSLITARGMHPSSDVSQHLTAHPPVQRCSA